MIKNYFYLTVGILSILFTISHTWNGLTATLPVLNNAVLDNDSITVFTYIWHIIGIENLVIGITLLIMAFQKNRTKCNFVAWFIIAILAMRWIVIFATTVIMNCNAVIQLIPDSIAIIVVIVLLLLGIKVKSKNSNG